MQLHPLLAPPLRRGLGPTLLSTPSELQQAEADLPRRRRKRHGKFGTRQANSHIEISILLKFIQEFYLPIFKCTYALFFNYWFESFWDKYMGAGEFSLWFFSKLHSEYVVVSVELLEMMMTGCFSSSSSSFYRRQIATEKIGANDMLRWTPKGACNNSPGEKKSENSTKA